MHEDTNLSCEVENVINSHPEVLECTVIVDKDPALTEDVVKACPPESYPSLVNPEYLDSASITTFRRLVHSLKHLRK
jgi:acyl-CoA synthetase (AMP-forming)/AMP-acid ligase II